MTQTKHSPINPGGFRERTTTGKHLFDQLCEQLDIEHRLSPVRRPQTNGMVERFNGRIGDILKTHRFDSGESLEQTIIRYVGLYNHHLPQNALGHVSPVQSLIKWNKDKPHLFWKDINNIQGHDIYSVPFNQPTAY